MHFKKREKEIIRKIASGEIKDITSYLQAFNLSTFHKLDKEKIENKFRQEEDGKTYRCLKPDVKIFNIVTTHSPAPMGYPPTPYYSLNSSPPKEDDYEYIPAKLAYNGKDYTVRIEDNISFTYDYFKGINITNSFSDIKTFLTIWQFLKSEGLVLEVDKTVSSQDYEPFFEFKPVEETHYGKARMNNRNAISFHSNLKPIEQKNVSFLHFNEEGSIKDFRKYIDYYFDYNKENELICSQFINKQIYGNSELDVFIKQNFKTNEQINLTRALIPAYLALVLSLGIAIWQKKSEDNSDIIKIQEQLTEIQATIEGVERTDLSQVEDDLQKIIDSNSSSAAEIKIKLDELLIELNSGRNK